MTNRMDTNPRRVSGRRHTLIILSNDLKMPGLARLRMCWGCSRDCVLHTTTTCLYLQQFCVLHPQTHTRMCQHTRKHMHSPPAWDTGVQEMLTGWPSPALPSKPWRGLPAPLCLSTDAPEDAKGWDALRVSGSARLDLEGPPLRLHL